MAKFDQFGSAAPGQGGSTRDCLRYEAMLADVMDGTLSAEDQTAFDRHRETCDHCSEMLHDAQRGAAWLKQLKPYRPEPSTLLVDRILAETSVRTAKEVEVVRAAQRAAAEAASLLGPAKPLHSETSVPALASTPPPATGKLLAFRNRVPTALRPVLNTILQTRFAMTAAMAFFSVAVTLNLTGVHLSDVHARDLRPTSIRRSFYEANAHVVRYYENLRVVYELESRVRDLQRSSDADSAPVGTEAHPSSETVKPGSTAPSGNSGDPAKPTPSKPTGKPRSGLSTGSQSGGHDPSETDHAGQSGLAGRHSTFVAPHGVIIPVSLSQFLPDRQTRGLA